MESPHLNISLFERSLLCIKEKRHHQDLSSSHESFLSMPNYSSPILLHSPGSHIATWKPGTTLYAQSSTSQKRSRFDPCIRAHTTVICGCVLNVRFEFASENSGSSTKW